MSTLDVIPLLRAPESWPTWVVGVAAMTLLAGLDLVGAIAAKEWSTSSRLMPLAIGVAAFIVLFWVYASALQYAELAIVTLGWIVALQLGLLMWDRFHEGVQLAPGKWVAVVVIVVAQAYLLAPEQVSGLTVTAEPSVVRQVQQPSGLAHDGLVDEPTVSQSEGAGTRADPVGGRTDDLAGPHDLDA